MREFLFDPEAVAADFLAHREEGTLGGVTDGFPDAVLLHQMRMIAGQQDRPQLLKTGGVTAVRLVAVAVDFSMRTVAFAGDFVVVARDVEAERALPPRTAGAMFCLTGELR